MDRKLFSFTIYERNGEQEYNNTCYVWANDSEEALELARDYAFHWYEPDEPEDITETSHNQWEMEDGYVYLFWKLGNNIDEVNYISIRPINGDRLNFDLHYAVEDLS